VVDVIKLYMDEHVPMAVTKALRGRGIDVIRAQDLGNHPPTIWFISNSQQRTGASS